MGNSANVNSTSFNGSNVRTPVKSSTGSRNNENNFIKFDGASNNTNRVFGIPTTPDRKSGIGSSLSSPPPSTSNSTSIKNRNPLKICRDSASQTTLQYNCTSDRRKNNILTSNGINLSSVLVTVVGVYVLICSLLVVSPHLQSIIVYINILRYPFGDLTDLRRFGISYRTARNIAIVTEDGLTLKGWHLIPPLDDIRHNPLCSHLNVQRDADACFDAILYSSRRVILYCHGNGATRAFYNRLSIIKKMAEQLHAHVITFDYRGFGDSEGWPSEYGTHLDAKAAFHWIYDRISGHNRSSSVDLTEGDPTRTPNTYSRSQLPFQPPPISGLILDAAFTSLVDSSMTHPLGAPFRVFSFFKKLLRSSLVYRYPSIDRIHRLRSGLLLLHGLNDAKIPFENSEILYKAALENRANCVLELDRSDDGVNNISSCYKVALQKIADASHNDVHVYPDWYDAIYAFINAIERKGPSTV